MRSNLPVVIGSASLLAVVAGTIYIIDCRSWAKTGTEIQGCYLTGLPIMGVGAAGSGGFKAGYNSYNPALRKQNDEHSAVSRQTRPTPPVDGD